MNTDNEKTEKPKYAWKRGEPSHEIQCEKMKAMGYNIEGSRVRPVVWVPVRKHDKFHEFNMATTSQDESSRVEVNNEWEWVQYILPNVKLNRRT